MFDKMGLNGIIYVGVVPKQHGERTMITLYFSAPDGSWTREAKTIEQARSIFNRHIGSGMIGTTYAVSNDGIVTCYADGCDLSDLMPREDWHEDQGNGWSAADHYAEDLEYN